MKSIILSIVTCGLVAVCLNAATAKPADGLTGVAAGDTIKKQKVIMKTAVPFNPSQKKRTPRKQMPKDTTKKQ